ncbi:carbohydrate/pyrimidine kinase [Prescottella equi NBRC 101255 = C 7]|nr:carbohydrate/pyrimidine kinase [Prescottella equi NBRC 101255 = C 7]
MRAMMLGVHVLDTLVRPVESIPEGQGGALVEQIAISPAGTAGGTGLVLSRLGVQVRAAGAIGDDVVGEMLTMLLEREGIDTSLLHRITGAQTSASVLPIRPDGSRPALHVVGANQFLGEHVPWEDLAGADFVHLGAVEFYGGDLGAQILERAHQHGAITSADSLAQGLPGVLDYIRAALPHIDYLLPNDEQVIGWTEASSLREGCERLLELGARCVVATAGAEPTVVATADGITEVKAFPVDVVDTSGCGDAFSAGFLRGISLGLDVVGAAEFGNATAAHTAQGLGSAYGTYDADTVRAFIAARSPAEDLG